MRLIGFTFLQTKPNQQRTKKETKQNNRNSDEKPMFLCCELGGPPGREDAVSYVV